MGIRRKIKRALPWWLGGSHGDRCTACGHVHAVSVHCVACDRPFCPMCVTVESNEPFCVECHEGGER